MNLKYVPIESILTVINRDYGKQVDEGDLIEWVGEALESLTSNMASIEKAIVAMEVKNYQCQLPDNCEQIVQIAKNNSDPIDISIFAARPDPTDIKVYNESTGEPIAIDINDIGIQIVPKGEVYYSSRFWNSATIREKFSPVRLSTATFFNELMSNEFLDNPYRYNNFEYIVVDGSTLRFNFENGQILVAYLRRILDTNGVPKIPDHYLFKDAIGAYVAYKLSRKDFYNRVQGSESRLTKSEQDWKLLREQARALAMIPQTMDEMERLVRNNTRLIRPSDRYDDFFNDNYPNYPNYFVENIYYK